MTVTWVGTDNPYDQATGDPVIGVEWFSEENPNISFRKEFPPDALIAH
ncbi:MAG: hypothetical protein DI537_14640 [Stutzerimonas stutzeri]|nr:MAG: hypothetical protein DI537_14640 [Stutzerimonas stutzeri]